MQRDQRLRRRGDFDAAYRQGRIQGSPLLVLRVRPNELQVTRFGFVTSKSVGGAVVRNRVKRRLRAIARALQLPAGFDVVVSARKSAAGADSAALRRSMSSALDRLGLLAGSAPGEAARR